MAKQKDETPLSRSGPRTTSRPRKAAAPKATAKAQRKAAPAARKSGASGRPSAPERRRAARRAPAKAEAGAVERPEAGEAQRMGVRPAGRGLDEQRFLFPRNYEVNRVRLVVRDPEWLFAYWDVNPRAFDGIRREMGERAMALSRLTLKVSDPEGGPAQVILLPYGARSWYVRIDPARPRYLAELGITLPSGQFRPLAQSNVVSMPRVGPSPHAAERSIPFRDAWAMDELSTGVGESAADFGASAWTDPGTSIRPGPLPAAPGGASERLSAEMSDRQARESGRLEPRGGASDLFRR